MLIVAFFNWRVSTIEYNRVASPGTREEGGNQKIFRAPTHLVPGYVRLLKITRSSTQLYLLLDHSSQSPRKLHTLLEPSTGYVHRQNYVRPNRGAAEGETCVPTLRITFSRVLIRM